MPGDIVPAGMKKCRMAAAEGRQDFPDSTFKLLNVLSSNEIRRALVKQRRPIPIILIKIRNVDVLLKNEISDRAQNSQPIPFVQHHWIFPWLPFLNRMKLFPTPSSV